MSNRKQRKEWTEWLKAIILSILIALFLQTFVFETSIVEGESMEPTLKDGERLVFNKIVYILGEPQRGDIVIIQQASTNYVKRVIALPGETIEIRKDILYINGERYIQSFLNEKELQRTGNIGPIVVPDDSYFVMGDNREISKDSRNGLGYIQRKEIIGRSEMIIYPFHEWEKTR